MADYLQYHVTTMVNNQIAGQPQDSYRNGKPLKTIRQRLVGKEGRGKYSSEGAAREWKHCSYRHSDFY